MDNSKCSVTVVTAYIDLCKYEPDRKNNKEFYDYMAHGQEVLKIDKPMVIFCEKENYHIILEKRISQGLLEKTIIIPIDFMNEKDVSANKWRNRAIELFDIKKNQAYRPYTVEQFVTEPKKSINYFIVTWSKMEFLNRVIQLNPFDTERFMWIDFGIAHVARDMHEITNWIDYIPEKIRIMELWRIQTRTHDTIELYRTIEHGYGTAGGLITGSARYIKRLNNIFNKTLEHMLDNGFLFLEEAVFAHMILEDARSKYDIMTTDNADEDAVGCKGPLFDVFWGGFSAICCNYSKPIAVYNIDHESIDYMLKNIEGSISLDRQSHAFAIIKYMLPAMMDMIGKMPEGFINRYMRAYLLAKWYVAPQGCHDEEFVRYIIKIIKSDRHVSTIREIMSLGYVKHYYWSYDILEAYDEMERRQNRKSIADAEASVNSTSIEDYKTKNLVLVTSVIHVIRNLPNSGSTKSVYSWSDRFKQTKKTIATVRESIPNSIVFVIECSQDLNQEELDYFNNEVDYFYNLYDDEAIRGKIHGGPKPLGEGTLTINALRLIRELDIQYDNLFKISGRYWLSHKFRYQNYENNNIGFTYYSNAHRNWAVTSLYKIPKKLAFDFEKFLQSEGAVTKMINDMAYEEIFKDFINSVYGEELAHSLCMNVIGITGRDTAGNIYTDF